ncbi:GTP cyclohydrolase I [Mycetocola lacteus]|uniref:GTP cyclohydrolase 1 n=1 Tax=Mycetocola lacteus TaxID=76637 RepID=A0A3L7AUS7_9MICO|nr:MULTISPECIES: GTP cyclohydrolase I [Mycetocola]MCS4277701.1 GTP cyclohydrolase I [Mycetocola sp. BIGb0189]RLP83934.1 GTP cyclohydrolase I [Mycetocola lacteus]
MAVDRERVMRAVSELIEAIGEDPARPGMQDTPRRVAEAYAEYFSGIGVDARALLNNTVPLDSAADEHETSGPGEIVLLRDIEFRSICEHHLLPFIGVAHVAYLPGEKVVGLGALPRVVDTLASRPQLQERLTDEIADTLFTGLDARGALVVMEAKHGCVSARGPRQVASSTVTMASRGELSDPLRRGEVFALIGGTHER